LEYAKPAVAIVLVALYAIGGAIAAWALAAAVAVLLVGLCAAETESVRRVMTDRRREGSTTASERMTG
ncbi:MAG: hypothetical protein JO363_06785, partial [Solirubrobacterales bacterium]|nr:hypothetical protein [Solirubrobacterales bacterium]